MAHLDLSYIHQNVTDDAAFIAQLLEVFLSGLEQDIPKLEGAIDSGDHNAIRSAAHKVKSGFRSLGMQQMTAYLQELEDMGKADADLMSIRSKYQGFLALLPDVKREVEAYKASI